jgi:hypothetical protein
MLVFINYQVTNFVFNNFFFNHAIYEIMWENIIVRGRPRITVLLMRNARSNPQSRNTHSEYVILTAFPLQRWLREDAIMLPYKSVTCLVSSLSLLANEVA